MNEAHETIEIIGVVDESGAGGGQFANEVHWTLSFSFAMWRDQNGKITSSPLRLRMPNVSHMALRKFIDDIKPLDILRVQVRHGFEENEFSGTTAILEKIIWA